MRPALRVAVPISVCLLLLNSCGGPSAPTIAHAQNVPAVIQSATLNSSNQLLVSGTGFGAAPTVQLGSISPTVTSSSPTMVTVALPSNLDVGSYLLIITNTGTGQAANFVTTLGAVGPAGPVGPTGPTGPMGPQGPAGSAFVPNYTYSTASLLGTYLVSMSAGTTGDIVSPVSFLGTLVLDGNGNITSGTLTEAASTYGNPGQTTIVNCQVSVTGSYSLDASSTGNALLNLAGTIVSSNASDVSGPIGNGNNCWAVPPSFHLTLTAAQQGQVMAFQMAPGDTSGFDFAGSGFKQ